MPHKAHKPAKRRRIAKRSSSNGHNGRVNARTMRALVRISEDLSKNAPIVKRKLRAAGVKPELLLVIPTALYYEALDRLAQE